MPFTIPLEITSLEKILSHMGITTFDQLLTQKANSFEVMTKLREFLNGKMFALSTFQTLFRTFRKSPEIVRFIDIKRIRLAPTLWIIVGKDAALFNISNEMLGIYAYLVINPLDSKKNTGVQEDPFTEFPEITEIVY